MTELFDKNNIRQKIEELERADGMGVRIFGYAYFVHDDFDSFVRQMCSSLDTAKQYKYKCVPVVARTFCDICSVDPKLVESYIGMTFEQLEKLV